jgi:Type III restriction enzyme, res subunit
MGQKSSWQVAANTPDVFKRILAHSCGVSIGSWRRRGTGYYTTAHDGLKIGRVNGNWFVKDFSNATLGDDKGRRAKSLLIHLYNLRTTKEAAEKLAALTGVQVENTEGYTSWQSNHFLPSQSLDFYYPNTNETGAAPKTHFDKVEYGSWDTPYGRVVLHHIEHKTKADFATIKASYRPIIRTSQNERVYNYSEHQFAYAVIEGQNARIFRPFLKSKKNDKMPLQNIGNYLFGFSNLPDDKNQCKVIFVVGGEHDCTAFNSAYNRYGWYAVTQGSETRNLHPELIKLLRKRCSKVVTFFDNDNAGCKGMEKQAREYGLLGIDLGAYVNNKEQFPGCEFDVFGRNKTLNDICDVLNTEGSIWGLKKLIDRELTTKRVAQSSPYRPVFSNVFHTSMNNYLGDTEGAYLQLKNELHLRRRVVLVSSTGSGKTYLTLHGFANDPAFFKLMGIERIVYCCPTNSIGQQQADKHNIPFLTSLEGVNPSEVSQSRVIAATFDQVGKMPKEWLDSSLFIVDEFHTITSEFAYRNKAMRCLLNLIKSAKNVLGITATPNLGFVKHLNYSLVVAQFADVSKAQTFTAKPIFLENGGAKDVLTDIVMRRDASKVSVIKLDNVNLLNSYKDSLVAQYGESAVTVMSSKTDEMCVNNTHYQSLMKTGRVGAGLQFVLCTKLLEAGINFDFPAEIFYVHSQATDSLLQMLARPRIDRKNGVNLDVKAFVYIAKGHYRTKDKLTELTQRFTAFANGEPYALSADMPNQDYELQTTLKNHQALCDAFNVLPKSRTNQKGIQNTDYPIILNPLTQLYEVDELKIFHKQEAKLQQLLRGDVIGFFAELKTVNPHIWIEDLEVVNLKEDNDVRKALTDIRAATENQKTATAAYFADANTSNAALTIAYFEAKNQEIRLRIERELERKPLPHEAESARQRLGVNTTEKGSFLSVASQYLEFIDIAQHVKYANGVQPIKAADIQQKLPEILRGYEKTKDRFKRLGERLTADHERMSRENAPTVFAGRVSNAIREQVFSKRADRRIYSKTDLFDIYNTAVKKAADSLRLKKSFTTEHFTVVIQRIEALFEVDYSNYSKKKEYQIGAEITAKNIFDCHGSEENELTTMTNDEA